MGRGSATYRGPGVRAGDDVGGGGGRARTGAARTGAWHSPEHSLRNGRFCLQRDLVDRGEVVAARAAFRDYYVTRGLDRLRQRVGYFAPKVGVHVTSVAVRELGNRWASCSPSGAIAFHWKCMMAPPKVVDYVVVHELCHFHYLDHSEAFWNEVDKVLPDYRERKEWLRVNGAGLDV